MAIHVDMEKGGTGHQEETRSSESSSFDVMDVKEIERLGRIRPEFFKTRWSEIAFVTSICMSQIMTVSSAHPD